jgi:hypothetical protein
VDGHDGGHRAVDAPRARPFVSLASRAPRESSRRIALAWCRNA